jgi:hypothetical protein
MLCLTIPAVGGDFSYVVLNAHTETNSLVRVSFDGRSVTTIANRTAGSGLIKDRSGNYIVAATNSLLRVAPTGGVSTIARAPQGSQWTSVAQATTGDFLVADNVHHSIWRVSMGGESSVEISNYPAPNHGEWEDTSLIANSQGNVLLLEDNNMTARLFKVTLDGAVTPILLSRSVHRSSQALIDDLGDLLFMDYPTGELLRVTPAGGLASILKIPPQRVMVGLAQDPDTRDYIVSVTSAHRLVRIPQSGTNVTTLIENREYLYSPSALIVERNPN